MKEDILLRGQRSVVKGKPVGRSLGIDALNVDLEIAARVRLLADLVTVEITV